MQQPVVMVSLLLLGLAGACGGEGGERAREPAASQAGPAASSSELTAFQLEHGIGPVTEPITLGPVDPAAAVGGQRVFDLKCAACHKMHEKYVGPALGEVTARRSPAFILNMIMNPQEMVERHPVAKQLLVEYMSYMPYQNVTLEEARQIVEYLRTQARGER